MADNHINIEAERDQDEADALADLRKAVQEGAGDEWLLGFVRGYPFARRPAADGATTAAQEQPVSVQQWQGNVHGDAAAQSQYPADRLQHKPRVQLDPELKAALDEAAKTRSTSALLPNGSAIFINYGDQPEDTAHLNCTACGGSGHIDDQRAGAVADGAALDLPPLTQGEAHAIVVASKFDAWYDKPRGVHHYHGLIENIEDLIARVERRAIEHYQRKQGGEAGAHISDMALLIARLSYQLNKATPGNEFSQRATAYLKKHDLIGSPLRAGQSGEQPTNKNGESDA